jgi:NAD(P)H dehydrogenase (quinone)
LYEAWREELGRKGLPDHVVEHVATMARLHAQNRYDRLTRDVERLTGHPATSAMEFAARHASQLGADRARPEVQAHP